MASKPDFAQTIADAYPTTGLALELGQGVLDGQLQREVVRDVFGMLKKSLR